MYNSSFSDNSKIWIYQSNREFTAAEENQIHLKLEEFLKNWGSHGSIVKSGSNIIYNRFIIILANDTEGGLCGSAADRLVQFVKSLEEDFDLSLLDRMKVAYRKDNQINTVDMNLFRKMLEQGVVNENTIVFNNIVTTKAAFDKGWEVPVKESWHKELLALTV